MQNFNPPEQGWFDPKEYITIDIRRDLGARITFMGMVAFILGFVFLRNPRPLLGRAV